MWHRSEVRSRVCLLNDKGWVWTRDSIRHISKAGLADLCMASGEWEKNWWIQVHDSVTFSLYAPVFISAAVSARVPSFAEKKEKSICHLKGLKMKHGFRLYLYCVGHFHRYTINGAFFRQVLARDSKISLFFVNRDIVRSTLEWKDQRGCDMNVDSWGRDKNSLVPSPPLSASDLLWN